MFLVKHLKWVSTGKIETNNTVLMPKKLTLRYCATSHAIYGIIL